MTIRWLMVAAGAWIIVGAWGFGTYTLTVHGYDRSATCGTVDGKSSGNASELDLRSEYVGPRTHFGDLCSDKPDWHMVRNVMYGVGLLVVVGALYVRSPKLKRG